jgi:hypothetical protein
MEETTTRNDWFSRLNGPIAQILIITGLILVLFAPLIPSFKTARAARAQTEFSQVDTLIEVDLQELVRAQERERKDDQAAAQRDRTTPINYSLGSEEVRKQQQQRQAAETAREEREAARQKALEDKTEELKKKYDANARKRTLLDAQMSATGMRWHLLLLFIGNAMLLIGLMVLTLESNGPRQKVLLVILVVVMFSALPGVGISVLGSLGSPTSSSVSTP